MVILEVVYGLHKLIRYTRSESLVLLSILPAFYLFPIFHVFEKRIKSLKIPIILISFIANGIFVLQEKLFEKSNSNYFCSYNVILSLLVQFGLVIEHRKTEVFHFSRLYTFNLPF